MNIITSHAQKPTIWLSRSANADQMYLQPICKRTHETQSSSDQDPTSFRLSATKRCGARPAGPKKRKIQLPNLDSNTTAFQSPPNARGRDSGGRWDKEEGETVSRAEVAGAHRGSRGCRRAGSVPRDAGRSGDEEREPGRRLLYLLLFLLFVTTMARLRGV